VQELQLLQSAGGVQGLEMGAEEGARVWRQLTVLTGFFWGESQREQRQQLQRGLNGELCYYQGRAEQIRGSFCYWLASRRSNREEEGKTSTAQHSRALLARCQQKKKKVAQRGGQLSGGMTRGGKGSLKLHTGKAKLVMAVNKAELVSRSRFSQ
jgi:hypothetical protein